MCFPSTPLQLIIFYYIYSYIIRYSNKIHHYMIDNSWYRSWCINQNSQFALIHHYLLQERGVHNILNSPGQLLSPYPPRATISHDPHLWLMARLWWGSFKNVALVGMAMPTFQERWVYTNTPVFLHDLWILYRWN